MKMKTKRVFRSLLGVMIAAAIGLGGTISASAWLVAPSTSLNLSMNLVGMANVMGLQDSPHICNYTGVSSGTINGTMKTAYKYSTGTAASKLWICQVGNGPYSASTLAQDFGATNVHTAATNNTDCMVYMLYDLGDPTSTTVQTNMQQLGITSIDEYYALMAKKAIITVNALPGGGKAHEDAITCYYRFTQDWRSLFSANNNSTVSRSTMLQYGIACPNENNYFFETYESQKFIDGTDAFPGVYDSSNDGLIAHDSYYSSPVWQDTNEDASWNVINPVPSCSIYSRLSTNFSKDTDYTTAYNMKTQATITNYGTNYTSGEWYGLTSSSLTVNGVSINDSIIGKNWEWTSHSYIGGGSDGSYTYNTATKSHLGYGEYCPAGVTSTHDWYIPQDQVTTAGRFMTVIVRETGTLCGLDGFGHWHGVKVTGIPVSNVTTVNPELKDDSVVIDYGLPVDFRIDENDRVWSDGNGTPIFSNLALTNANRDDLTGYTGTLSEGTYGKLAVTQADSTACYVKYTPLKIMNGIDRFYYKVEKPSSVTSDSDSYETASITCIPATIMYYEDNFSASDVSGGGNASFVYSGSWSCVDNSGSTITPTDSNILSVSQSSDNVVYGYDNAYNTGINYSLNSAHKSGAKNDSLSFTFKGTGFDVIMRTEANDGYVSYVVTQYSINSDGSKGSAVKTYSRKTLNCKNNNTTTLYQLPVCSERYGTYAYYTVELISAVAKPIYIDGFRIYDPLGIYGESNAQNTVMDQYYDGTEKKYEKASVYDLLKDGSTVHDVGSLGIINNWNERYGTIDADGNTAAFATYVKTGPYNEIYLAPGQGVYFNVTNTNLANLSIQTEAKAINGTTTQMTIAVDGVSGSEKVYQMNTATSMYYVYNMSESGMTASSGTVTIMNTGTGYLSLSNMKFSKALATNGLVNYSFVDESGNPVEGCTVSCNGTSVTSNSGGTAAFSMLLGYDYTFTVSSTAPTGYQFAPSTSYSSTYTLDADNCEYNTQVVLYHMGTASYTFLDPNGSPISGVSVTLNGTTVTTGADGIASFSNLPFGSYTLSIETPTGYVNYSDSTVTIAPETLNITDTYNVSYYNLTPGSSPTIAGTPYATIDGSTFSMHNVTPLTTPGSYSITFTLDGVAGSSGYYDNKNYLSGTVTLYMNVDSNTIYYTSTIGGKIAGGDVNKNHSTKTGSFTNSVTTFSGDNITISFNDFFKALTGKTNLYNNAESLMPDGLQFAVTAYSSTLMYGDSASATLTAIDDSTSGSGTSSGSVSIGEDETSSSAGNTDSTQTTQTTDSQTTTSGNQANTQSSVQSIISEVLNSLINIVKSIISFLLTLNL